MISRLNRGAFLKVLMCLFAVGLGQSLLADGYRNPPLTAQAIGKSGNDIVFSDDASAVAYNPANLAFQKEGSFVASITFAHLDSTYTAGDSGVSAVADDPWVPLPNLFLSHVLEDSSVVLGLGITTPYGQGTEFGRTDLLHPVFRPSPIYEAQLALIDVNPTLAFQLSDTLAIGAGVSLIYSQLDFKQYFPWSAIVATIPDGDAEVDADGYGLGGNLGITWIPAESHRLALTYRSSYKVKYDGDYEVSGFVPLVPGTSANSDFSTEIEFPNIIGLGYGIALTDTLRVEANFEWLEWSLNESIEIDLSNNQPFLAGRDSIPNDWNDTIKIGAGGDWQFSDKWLFRAGYTFLETPIPDETISPLLPDADRHAMSVGLSYQEGPHVVDVGYTYSIFDEREPTFAENPPYSGPYDIDSDLLGLTYSYTF